MSRKVEYKYLRKRYQGLCYRYFNSLGTMEDFIAKALEMGYSDGDSVQFDNDTGVKKHIDYNHMHIIPNGNIKSKLKYQRSKRKKTIEAKISEKKLTYEWLEPKFKEYGKTIIGEKYFNEIGREGLDNILNTTNYELENNDDYLLIAKNE